MLASRIARALEGACKARFSRFCGSFEPIFDPNSWGNINIRILPHEFGSKINQNNPQKQRTLAL